MRLLEKYTIFVGAKHATFIVVSANVPFVTNSGRLIAVMSFAFFAVATLLCLSYALLCHATTNCPEVHARLQECAVDRTELLTDIYSMLSQPDDPMNCAVQLDVARAYAIIMPRHYKARYGQRFDDQVFTHCDWIEDGKYCAVDVLQTTCNCANNCDYIAVLSTLRANMLAYPDWSTRGVSWNNYTVDV